MEAISSLKTLSGTNKMKPEKASKLLFYTVIPEVKEVPWSPKSHFLPLKVNLDPQSHYGPKKDILDIKKLF